MEQRKKRRKFTRDFKSEAVRLVTEGGRSVASVARELDLHANQLHKWKGDYLENQSEAFPGQGHLPPKDEEFRRLKRKLIDVTEERDILKKAIAVFSRDPK